RKEILPLLGLSLTDYSHENTSVVQGRHDRAVCLAGNLPCLESEGVATERDGFSQRRYGIDVHIMTRRGLARIGAGVGAAPIHPARGAPGALATLTPRHYLRNPSRSRRLRYWSVLARFR